MLHKPNEWGDKKYGGYLNNSLENKELITGLGVNNDHKVSSLANLYYAINYTSSIKFVVNNDVLDFILNNKDVLFKDYYENDGLTNEKVTDNVLRDQVSLEVAKAYLNKTFYLNTYADWRGRIYCNSFYLSYQGSDLSLALLQFYDGELINEQGLYFLKVYGANLYDDNNISRSLLSNRIKWVDDNESNIINMNMNINFLMKADSRFAFIAFCLAYRNYLQNKKVHLPIFLDATASGIQHIAALLQDEELAKKVNLISNEEDKVMDIYSEMIGPVHQYIKEEVEKNPSDYKLGLIKINRKQTKPCIMTISYNVTVRGVADQLTNSVEKIKLDNLKKSEINKFKNYILPIQTEGINSDLDLSYISNNIDIKQEDIDLDYNLINN